MKIRNSQIKSTIPFESKIQISNFNSPSNQTNTPQISNFKPILKSKFDHSNPNITSNFKTWNFNSQPQNFNVQHPPIKFKITSKFEPNFKFHNPPNSKVKFKFQLAIKPTLLTPQISNFQLKPITKFKCPKSQSKFQSPIELYLNSHSPFESNPTPWQTNIHIKVLFT